MRVLLDENLDRRLRLLLADDHEANTVAERGWRGIKNGDLLRAAEGEFDALLTADRNIPYQQNLSGFDLVVVILEVRGPGFTYGGGQRNAAKRTPRRADPCRG